MDGARYWYSTQPTVTKLADDRAEQLKREPDKIVHELEQRLRENLRKPGDFSRVHAMPRSGQDVPDDLDARLVVLGIDHAYSKEPGSAGEVAAKAILESRGNTPRLYRNALVFLAPDRTRLQDLDEAARRYLAWESILDEKETLNLDPQQVKQAQNQKSAADGAVTARLPETYQWLLVPGQTTPRATVVEWETIRLSGQEALAERASRKLRSGELLISGFAASRLRMELDRVPLWRGDAVAIRQLAEDFAKYLYLPRLKDSAVLVGAIRDGLALFTWEQDSFAYAESYDESANRYRGLRTGQQVSIDADDAGLLVKPAVARAQLEAERRPVDAADKPLTSPVTITPNGGRESPSSDKPYLPQAKQLRRFHGSVTLDANRAGRDASRIADEVIAHLVGLVGADVMVTLDISAEIPAGVPDQIVRTVTENARTLKFSSHGFEAE